MVIQTIYNMDIPGYGDSENNMTYQSSLIQKTYDIPEYGDSDNNDSENIRHTRVR